MTAAAVAAGTTRSRTKKVNEKRHAGPSSGNHAFDEYREETLKRLEEEQEAFKAFLDQLRQAKDKAEFDQFMADRGPPPRHGSGDRRKRRLLNQGRSESFKARRRRANRPAPVVIWRGVYSWRVSLASRKIVASW